MNSTEAQRTLAFVREIANGLYEAESDYDERGWMIKARRYVDGEKGALGFLVGIVPTANDTLARALDYVMRRPEDWPEEAGISG